MRAGHGSYAGVRARIVTREPIRIPERGHSLRHAVGVVVKFEAVARVERHENAPIVVHLALAPCWNSEDGRKRQPRRHAIFVGLDRIYSLGRRRHGGRNGAATFVVRMNERGC